MSLLTKLTASRVRVKLLYFFITHPDSFWYVRELTRLVEEEINAVRRELDRFLELQILLKEDRGNRVYYTLNQKFSFYQELLEIYEKTEGFGARIVKSKQKLGKLKYVVLNARFSRNLLPESEDDIDILFVGSVALAEIENLISEEEKIRGREIRYTIMSPEEFNFRKQRRDPFLQAVLLQPRIMVVGDEVEMLSAKQIQAEMPYRT